MKTEEIDMLFPTKVAKPSVLLVPLVGIGLFVVLDISIYRKLQSDRFKAEAIIKSNY